MKTSLIILLYFISLEKVVAQGNRVFSGAEIINYDIVDISVLNGLTWSTERAALPGYFSVMNSAVYTGCSDIENIDGYIKKYGNTSFIFPVGNGNDLRTLEISAPASGSDTYATAWIAGDPSLDLDPTAPGAGAHPVFAVTAPINLVSSVGQWDWQVGEASHLGNGTTGTGTGLTITVSIPDLTQFAPPTFLRLVGWNGTRWIDLSGTPTASGNKENSTLSGTMVADITAIAIGRTSQALPIRLESFTVQPAGCTAILNWKTSEEVNTLSFIVEQSFDTVQFYEVATVFASGSPTGSNYSLTVPQLSDVAYYRLKMKDRNGSYSYSPLLVCKTACDSRNSIQVYPNPVESNQPVNVRFTTAYRGKAVFLILNSLGQRILAKTIVVTGGTNLVSADVSRLASATYFIRLTGADGTPIGKGMQFIKQ